VITLTNVFSYVRPEHMSNKLTERWRPAFFRDVIGQGDAVEWCRRQILSGRPRSVLFHGATGCGKNTLARVFACAAACDKPTADGEPCGSCEACKTTLDVIDGYFYVEVPSGKATLGEIKQRVDWLRSSPLVGRRKILVFDEAQGLKRSKSEILFPLLDRRDPSYLIILLTTDLSGLIAPLRDRLKKQEVLRPSTEQLAARGKEICAAENIRFEPRAIERLAEVSTGYRAFLQHIEDIAGDSKSLTEQAVRDQYLGHFGALALLKSLLCGELREAHEIIERQTRPPATVQEAVQEILVAAQFQIRNCTSSNGSLAEISPAALSSVIDAGDKSTAQASSSPLEFWDQLVARWTRFPCRSKTDLRSLSLETFSWLHEQPNRGRKRHREGSPISVVERTPSSARPHRLPQSKSVGGYMSLQEAKRIWNAGAALGQLFGTYLNARVVFRPALAGFDDQRASFGFFVNLIRSLRGRVEDWSDAPLHWLYSQSGVDANELYLLALCLPDGTATASEVWLEEFLAKRGIPSDAVTFRSVLFSDARDQSRYHTGLLRLLCRAIDPSIMLRRRALIDVINIPGAIRPTVAGQYVTPKVSQTIGRSAIRHCNDRGLPLLLPANDGAWNYRNFGWELAEHEDRNSEIRRVSKGRNVDPTAFAGLQTMSSSRDGAKLRKRSWPTPTSPGWWQPAFRSAFD
jgi:hypothetical protein